LREEREILYDQVKRWVARGVELFAAQILLESSEQFRHDLDQKSKSIALERWRPMAALGPERTKQLEILKKYFAKAPSGRSRPSPVRPR
jgi:hypothetical protein